MFLKNDQWHIKCCPLGFLSIYIRKNSIYYRCPFFFLFTKMNVSNLSQEEENIVFVISCFIIVWHLLTWTTGRLKSNSFTSLWFCSLNYLHCYWYLKILFFFTVLAGYWFDSFIRKKKKRKKFSVLFFGEEFSNLVELFVRLMMIDGLMDMVC